MAKNLLKFYPVDNGDMSLITLDDNTTILVDCNIRQASVESTDSEIYDVKTDLIKSIMKRDNNPFVDIFILTHGDNDHCRGFKNHFYQGDPTKYTKANRDAGEIIIDEMWFSPMVAEENTNDDEEAHQKEAERRLELHRKKSADRNLPGNRIKIIGYDGNKDYSDLNHLRAIPGTVMDTFNESFQSSFSVFIHAPFKELLTSNEKDKNSASIVFQARFKSSVLSTDFSCLVIFGGDSDHTSWKLILDKTLRHENDTKEQALDWDLFLAPHHCSWSFFNDTPQNENPEPSESSLQVLSYMREDAIIISSSKKILNNDDNPPHYKAKKEYQSKVGKDNFLNTAVEPSEKKPEPIEFEITQKIKRIDNGAKVKALREVTRKISAGIIGTARTGKLSEDADSYKHQPHKFYGDV